MTKEYKIKRPTYPSAEAVVRPEFYMDAVEALEGVPQVFCDGESIYLPESETVAIEMLRTQFNASITLGQGQKYEFATKAVAAGVSEKLVGLGHAVQGITGLTADQMVSAALQSPSTTHTEWSALYTARMEKPQ